MTICEDQESSETEEKGGPIQMGSSPTCTLPIFLLNGEADDGERIKLNALPDHGSQKSFVHRAIANKLSKRNDFWNIEHCTFQTINNISICDTKEAIMVTVISGKNAQKRKSSIVMAIVDDLPWTKSNKNDELVQIDVVLSAYDSLKILYNQSEKADMELRKEMGHLKSGIIDNKQPPISALTCITKKKDIESFHKKTARINKEGRIVVEIPFTENVKNLSNTKALAMRRLFMLEKRFTKDSELKSEYKAFMTQYIKDNLMQAITDPADTDFRKSFFPHHAVYKISEGKRKLRVVFDASARSDPGCSFNQATNSGPVGQSSLKQFSLDFVVNLTPLWVI
jgi:hypothetical protein